ncbi:HK97 gp10 family phage protein [Paenibacillus sp. sptzw28]|uniref:HK97 gp10 family phage protein n=1 Tax=Paenibacillus sp. sptzw28 TaxID=715179 RepID=UPI001C6DE244|nr:HK97 gp10 family phage protein [Paenibacillus sp. sptzw28]QYR20803.1 HK97 gp10 family phage protein [Paenibacillus sp. sptzw28]
MARRTEILGMKELQRDIKLLGRVPQAAATKGARAGARIALKAAKANAPEDTGALKSGIILKKERKSQAGKAVYDVMPSPAMNDVFVKVSKKGKRSYYPASQEYGFLTEDGGYIPGYRYMRRAIDDNKTAIERTVLDVAGKEVDKVLRKKGLR